MRYGEFVTDRELHDWRTARETIERDKKAKAMRHPKAAEFLALTERAHAAGMVAGRGVTPVPMIVSRRENPLDDRSPAAESWSVPDGLCGFAGVRIRPGTTAFARWLVGMGLASKAYRGGVETYVHEFNQSVARKEAYAAAYAAVLREAGIPATSWSRLD